MELAARAPLRARHSDGPAELRSWLAPECEIGRRTFRGASDIVEVVEVAYQQKARTFGNINRVSGIMIHGDGIVAGGGGFIDTTHRSVATIVVRDIVGAENTLEVPADVSARVGSILRVDSIEGQMIAVTNLSGKRDICRLANSTDFLPAVKFNGWDAVLTILCVIGCGANLAPLAFAPIGVSWLFSLGDCLIFLVLFGTKPALKYRKIGTLSRQRAELIDYMNSVTE